MKLARGGARKQSGRIPLVERHDSAWIVRRIRELGNDPKVLSSRALQFIKKQYPSHRENQIDLQNNYDKLREASNSQRRTMIEDDCGTPLEETRQILATEGFPNYLNIPAPNQFQMNQIYKQVADEASQRFGRAYSVRNAKDCVRAWLKFERLFEESL